MALRLVRKASDTPNISNRDDACMVRYAYGGYDGVVKNFGTEIALTQNATYTFTIGSGRAVIQGWEIDVTEQTISVVPYSGQYYHIYLELNLLLEQVELKYVVSPSNIFPASIGLGDDLTQHTSGIARLPLYVCRLQDSYGDLVSAKRASDLILYAKDHFLEIDEKLERLGFRQGDIVWEDGSLSENRVLNRQGNYVIGLCDVTYSPSSLSYSDQYVYTLADGTSLFAHRLGQLSENILPKKRVDCLAAVTGQNIISGAGATEALMAVADTDGAVYLTIPNQSWSVIAVKIAFGYEAEPLNKELIYDI